MDQDMEADEFIPDKVIPDTGTSEISIVQDDISEDTDVVKEKSGAQTITDERVVNGNDEGTVTEDMDTDEPMSVPEVNMANMETEGVNTEVSNDLEELVTETNETEVSKYVREETTGPGEEETNDSEKPRPSFYSEDQLVSEQDLVDESENFNNGQKDIDDNLNLENDNPFGNIASGNLDDKKLNSDGSVEISNDEENFNLNEEIDEPLTQSEEAEGLIDKKANDETEVLDEDRNIESVQIEEASHQQIFTQNTEDISQDSFKSNQDDDQIGQMEDMSGNSKEEEVKVNLETARKDDDEMDEILLLDTSEDYTDKPEDDIRVKDEDLTNTAINNEAETRTEVNQEIENSLVTEVEAGNKVSGDAEGLSPIHIEDKDKGDINEEDLLDETDLYSEERSVKDNSSDIIDSSDAASQDIAGECLEQTKNSSKTEVEADNEDLGDTERPKDTELLSPEHIEDECKDDINEEDLSGEQEPVSEEKKVEGISYDNIGSSDAISQDITGDSTEENENIEASNTETVESVEDSNKIDLVVNKREMEISEMVGSTDAEISYTVEEPGDTGDVEIGNTDELGEKMEDKGKDREDIQEAMDVEPGGNEIKADETENMDVTEISEDPDADKVEGNENKDESIEQEKKEESKEEVTQEMVTDTDIKDQASPESDSPDKVAVTNTDVLKTEEKGGSALSEISNDTLESANSSSNLPSSESVIQQDTDSKSEFQTREEISNQSEDKSNIDVTPPGDNSNQSEAVSLREATPSNDNSNQTDEKSPAFDLSSVEIKKERKDSTESDKAIESENSQSGDSSLKITDVVSEDGKDNKGGHSLLTSDTVTAKGDNAGDKENTIQDNLADEKVKVKEESAASEKEAVKKAATTDDQNKKVKQESNKGKEEEDDDVIAIKEEKKPVQKPKPSKIQTCIVCAKVGKCKYNIVRNGDVKHLCDDTCFKQFRSSPTTYLKQAESAAQAQSKPDNQSNNKPAPVPAKNSAPVKSVQNQQASFQQQSQVYKTCTVCQLMNVRTSKPFLNWQGLDFCGEECLGKYQAGLSNNCSYCSGAIFPNNKAKFCCRVGNEVKHFCSTNCNNDYVKRMKLCAFCNKDLAQSTDSFMAPVGETFKDFCSQSCLQKFEEKNSKDIEIVGVQKGQKATKVSKGNFTCAVCGKVGPAKHEFKLDAKMNRLCSDPCFSAFQYANKLTLNTCDNCGTNLNSENQAPQYVQFEGQQRRFCSFMCVNTFRNTNKKTVPCAWCASKKSNFDMIERVDANNKYQLFCSLNCLSLYRVNLQATSNQAVSCDQCKKYVPAQYHLTMSDASVRNFCSYGCVMQFQAQFQTPAKQVPQQTSLLNNTVLGKGTTPSQTQQTTTTRSGRVVTKAPKVAAAVQQQVIAKGRSVKKDDSFPIISNVVSLAPQGTQQQTNVKSTTHASVTNQDTGIKTTTTTTGNQTVQQQIIIQPPPPASMKNKSLLCKPFTQTKATSCRPHTQIKEVQTEGKVEPEKYLIPIPVPIYCPTPLAMYSLPTPVLIPVPVPIPVPVFIPTTKKSAHSILKQIKEIREKIPADPLEAELLMMAEAVAGKEEESSSSSEDEDNTAPPEKETSAPAPPTGSSGGGGGELGEDMLQMALRMASEMTDEPVMDLENSLEPVAVNTEPPPQPKPDIPSTPQPVEEEEEYIPSSARSRRSRGGNKRQSRSTPRRNPKRQKVEIPQQYHEATPSPPAPAAPPPDANFHLKYTYGVNAFKHWVIQKNSQIEQASKPGHGKHLKTFKTDILQCTADELNYSLCLFVKEVRKPNGEEYAVDSIYYLCLGIQQYLFENGRIDNIFTDFYYERFTEGLNEILTRYEPKLNHAGQLVCRIEEEHLWESKQLGAHSPHVLLNSLVYFNTKYFMLKTSEDHLKLSFTHIMKHWKKTASGRGSGTGPNAGRSVYLRYYCPTPQGKDNQKKKKEEMPVYEQTENLDNPLRCPVKLYEFYLSKCPESIKNRNDTFYLKPERSSVPDSPVWYSNQSMNIEHLTKLLNRIRLVREIQEAHLHTQPIYI